MHGLKLLFLGMVISLLLYYPAFGTFFTNDDFFHLKISRAASFSSFINFFNPLYGPEKLGLYRPLTTQVYYWISVNFFKLNPLPLKIISFGFLILISLLVYNFVSLLTLNKIASGFASLLYLLSATHFGHLYYAGTFQELGMAFFCLASAIMFWKQKYIFSLALFILALLSKETAIMLPFLLSGLYYFRHRQNNIKVLSPYLLILAVYAFLRFRYYGFATGDSYLWDVSPKILNTVSWYLLWCLNLPEMLVDFVGPGLHLNPNLWLFWGREMTVIFALFGFLLIWMLFILIRLPKTFYSSARGLFRLAVFWFIVTLGPLLFLPWHKFAYNLTLPLVGVVMFLGLILAKTAKFKAVLFVVVFLLLTVSTLSLTVRTHWIIQGENTARNVDNFVAAGISGWPAGTDLVFYDTQADNSLPWSPADVLKTVLSDNNYFQVFWPHRLAAVYLHQKPAKISADMRLIAARQFLGY